MLTDINREQSTKKYGSWEKGKGSWEYGDNSWVYRMSDRNKERPENGGDRRMTQKWKKNINNNNDRRIRIRDKKNTTINANDKTQIIGAITCCVNDCSRFLTIRDIVMITACGENVSLQSHRRLLPRILRRDFISQYLDSAGKLTELAARTYALRNNLPRTSLASSECTTYVFIT